MSLIQGSRFRIVVTSVLFLLISLSFAGKSSAMSCMPTCSSTDGRFLLVVDGPAFETLTTRILNLRIVIPGDATEFSLGIFDGDSNVFLRNWDLGVPFLISYNLKIDPDMDNNGPSVFEEFSTNLPNNAWKDYILPTNPTAQDENGDFVYTLTITAIERLDPALPDLVSNAFKIRTSGLVAIDEIFTFSATSTGSSPDTDPDDLNIIYPNLDDSNGVG